MTKISESVYKEQKVWGESGNEDFFQQFRSSVDDLYRSEKFFLPHVLEEVSTCIDVGCACGGFSEIMKSFNPGLQYTGVDIIGRFIDIAKAKYPESKFILGDGTSLELDDNTFELAHSTGILHLTNHYKDIVREMYRVSSKYVLCDFRLTKGTEVKGQMDVNLIGQDGLTQRLPYWVINLDEHIEFLKGLEPKPSFIEVKGYAHAPTKLAKINIDEIIMAFFLITKGDGASETKININLEA